MSRLFTRVLLVVVPVIAVAAVYRAGLIAVRRYEPSRPLYRVEAHAADGSISRSWEVYARPSTATGYCQLVTTNGVKITLLLQPVTITALKD